MLIHEPKHSPLLDRTIKLYNEQLYINHYQQGPAMEAVITFIMKKMMETMAERGAEIMEGQNERP